MGLFGSIGHAFSSAGHSIFGGGGHGFPGIPGFPGGGGSGFPGEGQIKNAVTDGVKAAAGPLSKEVVDALRSEFKPLEHELIGSIESQLGSFVQPFEKSLADGFTLLLGSGAKAGGELLREGLRAGSAFVGTFSSGLVGSVRDILGESGLGGLIGEAWDGGVLLIEQILLYLVEFVGIPLIVGYLILLIGIYIR